MNKMKYLAGLRRTTCERSFTFRPSRSPRYFILSHIEQFGYEKNQLFNVNGYKEWTKKISKR